ncbi:MAG: hypothetical protein HY744_21895 [Deltaproteobacteria bacterium]|nr:hypothetical protein [Deltaproteobacteria bacterium]
MGSKVCLVLSLAGVLAAGCREPDPNDPSSVGGQQPTGYDQYGNPVYGQQPGGYPGQQPGGYPGQQPGGYPGQQPGGYPGQQPGGQGAQPSPLAPPCQSDQTCLTYRCNLQTQRCAFPCTGPADCAAGYSCLTGLCVPGAGAAPQ